ncbi:MAG: hypothetical protein K9G71_16320 [Rhodobacteraceae bacterium]|nr:hypothetical protein [Paracoccaceae bacterium]MCF8516862.1 hypothetical protein [Paracoccaceae bacterium]MCF8520149.1 hypothetical protein [Paracoccaceae bacterium]
MKIRALILLIVTLAFGAAPFVTEPFRGYDPAMFPVLIARPSIQPAGYAFAIWSVIYLWLITHAVFGLWKRATNPAWDRTRLPLSLAIGIGAVWLGIANGYPILATVTICIMMASAVLAFLWADVDVDRWLLAAPTAIFAGWLSAAAAVSLGVVLAGYGWLSDTVSAVTMLGVVLAIAVNVQMRRPQMPVYGMTVIWALAGVVAVNWGINPVVATIAASGIVIMVLTVATTFRRSH